jgi:hypothetical protein
MAEADPDIAQPADCFEGEVAGVAEEDDSTELSGGAGEFPCTAFAADTV